MPKLAFFARELTKPADIPAGASRWLEDSDFAALKASPGGAEAVLDVTPRFVWLAVCEVLRRQAASPTRSTAAALVACTACCENGRVKNPMLGCEACAGARQVIGLGFAPHLLQQHARAYVAHLASLAKR